MVLVFGFAMLFGLLLNAEVNPKATPQSQSPAALEKSSASQEKK